MGIINFKNFAVYIVVLATSCINYDNDLLKFLFTGYSSTYDIIIIRHHYLLTVFFATLIVALSVYSGVKKIKWTKYLLIPVVCIWIFSMRTYALVTTENILVSGWSFIPFNRCELGDAINSKEKLTCVINYDPFLMEKLEKELNNFSSYP